MGTDVPVQTLEPLDILELVAARHEHDMTGLAVRLQGVHASLEKPDAVYLTLFELIDGMTEHLLFIIEERLVPGRIIIPVKCHSYAVKLERLEGRMFLEQIRVRQTEHTAGILMTGPLQPDGSNGHVLPLCRTSVRRRTQLPRPSVASSR